jgi:cobalt/nickel transport system ATP-binding protein
MPADPSLLLVGHGSRSVAGVAEYWDFAGVLAERAGDTRVGCGFIELAQPDLDTAVDKLVADGAQHVVAVPLVLLGAGHMKNDGPAALARGRLRHGGVRFAYGRDLGIHPLVLAVAEERIKDAVGDGDPAETAVVLVSRGSSDPDANADLFKVARLLQDSRGLAMVEASFVSLAPPDVPAAMVRCRRLGARRIVVVPYFLFTGILVDRIGGQARAWAAEHPDITVSVGAHLGPDPRIADLVLERHREAAAGETRMNCDLCVYRAPLPGYEARVGVPLDIHAHHDHSHDDHSHDDHSH